MRQSVIPAVVAMLLATVALPSACRAAFPTIEEALAETFGEGVEITAEVRELDAATLIRLEDSHARVLLTNEEKEAWGCPLAEDYEEAMEELQAAEYQPKTSFEFYHAVKDGKKLGSAVVVDAPGKWGMVDYIVGLDLEGAVTRVDILSHSERRGKGISRRTFLTQFEGKTADDEIELMKDITGVSGATVSSRSACAAVTKAVVLYREFYLTEAPKTTPAAPETTRAAPKATPEVEGDGNAEAGQEQHEHPSGE